MERQVRTTLSTVGAWATWPDDVHVMIMCVTVEVQKVF